MIDFVRRSPHKAASLAYLRGHIAYLSNAHHPDHIGKVEIQPPKFYGCKNAVAFVRAVEVADETYIQFRSGSKGKRTDRVWDEAIYRTPDNTDLGDGDRTMIELTMLSIKRDTPTVTQWHKNIERGSWDLHVLTPAKSTDWPPRVLLSASFGAGKKHVYATLERLDQDLVDALNVHRPPHRRIVSALEKRKQKAKRALDLSSKGNGNNTAKGSLAALIAKKATGNVAANDLKALVEALGIVVTRCTDRFISVIFPGRKQPRRYAIDSLLLDIDDEIHLRHAKERDDESSGDGTGDGIA